MLARDRSGRLGCLWLGCTKPHNIIGPVDQTRGILLTLRAGQILLLGPQGEKRCTMAVDLPIETPAVAADLLGDGHLSVVAVDTWGSVYCFDESGQRRWKKVTGKGLNAPVEEDRLEQSK